MQRLILRHGDCVEVLKDYEDGSIGAVISDPPYHIAFMGKEWDVEGAGIAFSARLWGEVYRVLRPGGVVKAFSGTRTFHRMAAAMQEAGFINMSVSCWCYGSGFPKSMNISKQIDKTAGVTRTEVIGKGKAGSGFQYGNPGEGGFGNLSGKDTGVRTSSWDVTAPATEAAQRWSGWGTALKPGFEPVIVGRKPE